MVNDKVIVVTGGAGLLGREFVKAMSLNKAKVVVAEIDLDIARKVLNELLFEYKECDIELIELDITSEDSINNLIYEVDKKYGRIDAVVNNAYPRNSNYGNQFFDVEYSDFCENISMNIGGYFLVSKLFSKYFIKQGYGNIVNIASIYGVIAPRFEIYDNTEMTMPVEYAAIKSGLIHLTKYMAKYFKNKNIRVNSISLGGIKNNQPESFIQEYKELCLNKGMLDASDISGTLMYLLSDMSKYVNGQNLIVDDGFTL